MTNNLEELLSSLPESNMTVRLLNFLDYLVPGEWNNITSLHLAVRVSGKRDEGIEFLKARRAAPGMDSELQQIIDQALAFAVKSD